ncbi:GPMC system family 4 glycosyltransferase [Geotalea sp. SG265]|uniref:GPMC system family 4 glycosyltransferase n=1 Tax=Geotalea sp. SG265 TaxID=2922867 RepID=UPI001FAE91DB|nr:GPMC system family 4 glycosyltransferase [Geotalea sp. SG265]
MKIALITPHYFPLMRGNAVTVSRIEKNLVKAGITVAVHSLDAAAGEEIGNEVAAARPDLIHAFHGHSGGRIAHELQQRYGIPYVITLTGTDVYEALTDHRRDETLAALDRAAYLAVFHESIRDRLLQHIPDAAEKTVVIPQGVELPEEPCPGNREFPHSPGTFTFFLPAGLRPVKNVLFPLGPLAVLHGRYPQVRLILAGPVLDPAYAAQVMETLEGYSFAHYLGGIGHESMGCLYNKAQVVLNTSLFEGGMANSVLEALAYGRAVLAADIEGNRSLIADGTTGFLYNDERLFLQKAELLLRREDVRAALGAAGRGLVRDKFAPERETAAYLGLYERVKGEG